MTNIHGLKQKHKTMIHLVTNEYDKKAYLEKELSYVNEKISRLEKAKHNCMNNIRGLKHGKKK